jgi:uncharacterized damage-inducible protein DinB
MQFKQYLETLYDYNHWANQRYLAVAEKLTEKQFFHKHGHSWESVHSMFVHMMSSERMWRQRWLGEPAEFLDAKNFLTFASIRDYWIGVEKNTRDFISAQTEESLQKNINYTNPKGETFTLPLWQMMVQPPNHNTHHRGELAGMFALMNVPHPEDEFIQYFLTVSGQKKF